MKNEFNISVFLHTIIENTVTVCVPILFLSYSCTIVPTEAVPVVVVIMMAYVVWYWLNCIYLPAVQRIFNSVRYWMRGQTRNAFNALRGLGGVGNHGVVMNRGNACFDAWNNDFDEQRQANLLPHDRIASAANLLRSCKEHTRDAFNCLRGLDGVENHGHVMANIEYTLDIGNEIAQDPATLESVTRDLENWKAQTRNAFMLIGGFDGVQNHGQVMTTIDRALQAPQ